jgi:peptidoglycan hydrolase-like protein with peptidoglycan-binding domain
MSGTEVLRRVGVGVATVLMAGAGLVVSAGSAAAEAPLCVKMAAHHAPSGRTLEVPVNSDGRAVCLLGRDLAANVKVVNRFQHTMIRCYGGLSLASPYQNEKIRDLSTDGSFGPRTEAALEAVQKNIGVTADGTYGPVTRDHMKFMSPDGRCYSYM